MKRISIVFILALLGFQFQSCEKDDPTPEVDQEEVGTATLTFTEVEAELHGDHYDYHDIADPDVETITFSGTDMLPPVGAHVHLEEGKSYRFELKTTDFAGRESQQTFVERDDIHYAFILGAPENTLRVEYADRKSDGTRVAVGVTGYLTVLDHSNTFVMEYVMRHLNPGVKAQINTAEDWNATNYQRFGGANDIHLRFEMHFVEGHDHDHD